jgi:hypothetical protein
MKQLLLAVLLIFTSFCYSQECDLLILKDGSEISVLVTELRLTEIAYKKCDNLNGPMYVVRNQEVFMIKFKNGTSQVIKSEETSENKQVVSVKEKLEKDKIYFEPKRFYVEPEIGYGRCIVDDWISSMPINNYYSFYDYLKSSMMFNAKFGYSINRKFGAGLLIGYNRLKKNYYNNFRNMTTFAAYARLCYGGKRIISFSDFELGALLNMNKKDAPGVYGIIDYERAFYIKPTFCLSFPVTQKLNIQAGIAYTYMQYYMKGAVLSQDWNGQNVYTNYRSGHNIHVLSLNFSVRYML